VPDRLEFYGDAAAHAAFVDALATMERIGGKRVEVDFGPFLEAAALLYEGPWVAERYSALRPFFDRHADAVHPVVREIVGNARACTAADLFAALTRLESLKKRVAHVWEQTSALVVPSVPRLYRIDEVLAEPFGTNRRMGHYANFVNLMDLAALAVPGGTRTDGMPAGVTLIGPAGSDLQLADLGRRLHAAAPVALGALGLPVPAPEASWAQGDTVDVVVVGAHLSGQPLNGQLVERRAQLMRTCRTAPRYRLYALPGTNPPKPGLIRDPGGGGEAIEVEVWRLPASSYGSFVALIAAPLGIARVELDDGSWVQGFVCEGWAAQGAADISAYRGWRAYLSQRAHQER
jgi:allophanate hydrolase